MPASHLVELRSYKWPRRSTYVTKVHWLGEDTDGFWLGARKGEAWQTADASRRGVYAESLVKWVPRQKYWAACFQATDPVVDVDMVMPLAWRGGVLEEIDLELDVLRTSDGRVEVRDRDIFERVRLDWQMPNEVALQVELACKEVCALLSENREPFCSLGAAKLREFGGWE